MWPTNVGTTSKFCFEQRHDVTLFQRIMAAGGIYTFPGHCSPFHYMQHIHVSDFLCIRFIWLPEHDSKANVGYTFKSRIFYLMTSKLRCIYPILLKFMYQTEQILILRCKNHGWQYFRVFAPFYGIIYLFVLDKLNPLLIIKKRLKIHLFVKHLVKRLLFLLLFNQF